MVWYKDRILFNIDIQLIQYIWKDFAFSHWIIFAIYKKYVDIYWLYMFLYISGLSIVLLIYISNFSPKPNCRIDCSLMLSI